MWQFWIDRGGTFTDIVAKTPEGEIQVHKLLSDNPEQYDDAAVFGVRELLGVAAHETLPEGTIDTVRMGTTVATNGLLERSGDRTVLVTTQGLGDLLRIGYQNRPRLFDLHIRRPAVLHERTIEALERVDAHGNVVTPLDEDAARAAMRQAFDTGIRSAAIALMHGYRYSEHERRLAEIAREVGFTEISTSHEVSPLMKLIPRGDTTVMDAYLSPILKRYVNEVADALGADHGACRQLLFMQSNGGLTDANLFQGKDAILSGPCGGVVGMARTGEQAGLHRLIGFDMGGTSTDVCHYNGEFERSMETEVGGVRVRVPMMNIHTVAAGGGSIVRFDGARFRVGPESAGANPGPACYRRGGPLSVTDCNVLLGRIQPDHFPRVFGESGDQPVDLETVLEHFAELTDEINTAIDASHQRTVEDVAEGFLRIAIENMANAIKKISVERGYDVTQYALQCFGGAGGQHACRVADALGMNTVLLHPLAGVLSAYGMGLADVRALRDRQVEKPLDDDTAAAIERWCDELAESAREEVGQQTISGDDIEIRRLAHLRYRGAHQSLAVDVGSVAAMTQAFDAAHRARFGFAGSARELTVEAITVEAIGAAQAISEPEVPEREPAKPIDEVAMRSDGQWLDTPVFERNTLAVDQCVEGPAIIIETTGTNIIEAGWQARLNKFEHLLIERAVARDNDHDIGTDADPVMLEIFNNLFMSIAEQMGATLANTAYSVNIKERYDFSCALFDAEGGLVANAPHVPVHLGSMSAVVRALIQDKGGDIRPGDVYVSNVPFKGGTHLPDVTVITPVFDEAAEHIIFFVGSRGHHADIGGRTPGSSPPDSTHIREEGVLIDNIRMVAEGELLEDEIRALLASGDYPCRNVDENMADLSAQVAANETGVNEIGKMVGQFGLDVVQAYMSHVQDNAEQCMRRVLDELDDSAFDYELDNGSHIKIAIRVDRDQREADIDFTGTSPQIEGNYNAPLPICHAAVLYVFRTLITEEIPLNEGCLRPLHINAPEDSIVNCRYPAAVIAGNTEVSQSICEALYGALGVIAGSQGTVNNFAYGNDRYQNYETICGGTGAGPDFEGASAVHSHMTNTRLTDPEVLEFRYPVRVDKFAVRPDSGGKGHYNGGDGVVRWLRFLESMTATTLSSHRRLAPFGVDGGQAGARGRNAICRSDGSIEELSGNDERTLDDGDVFIMETPGGGGYGKLE